jgi:hypothetical protein
LKLLFKVLKWTSLAFGVGIVLLILASWLFESSINKLVINQVNKTLAVPIAVDQVSLSLWRHFPYAAVQLTDVSMEGTLGQKDKPLLKAGSVSLLFDLSALWNNSINFKKIILRDGMVNICFDQQGKDNYHFWKTDTTANSSTNLSLQEVILEQMQIGYDHPKLVQSVLVFTDRLKLKGSLANEVFNMEAVGALVVKKLNVASQHFLKEQQLEIELNIKNDNQKHVFEFKKSVVSIKDLSLILSGKIKYEPVISYELAINSAEASLGALLALLPGVDVSFLQKINATGQIKSNSTITSNHQSQGLLINTLFEVSDGAIAPPESKESLTAINGSGKFIWNIETGGSLHINKLKAQAGSNPLEASLSIQNFKNPILKLYLRTAIELSLLKPWLRNQSISDLSGKLIADINYNGPIANIKQQLADHSYTNHASGTIQLRDVSISIANNHLAYNRINGHFKLNNHNLEIVQLSGYAGSTDVMITGEMKNFLAYLLLPNQHIECDGSINSQHLFLDEWLTNYGASSNNETAYKLKISDRIKANLAISIGKLTFRKFEAARISGQLSLTNQIIRGQQLKFAAMQGLIGMDAVISAESEDDIITKCDAAITNLDITQLFYQLENFDQQTLTDKNLKGKVDAAVSFSSHWTPALDNMPASTQAGISLTIRNGELNNFAPIQAMSKYLKLADLKNIRFNTLKNNISISNRKVYIPQMEIASSAINITASGVHDFDNNVDYSIKLLLSDVLGKKAKSSITEFGAIQDDGLGRSQLFLSMKGKVDDPKFSYDRKAVAEKIKVDVAKDATNIKNALKEDFNLLKGKQNKTTNPPSKKEELELDLEEE